MAVNFYDNEMSPCLDCEHKNETKLVVVKDENGRGRSGSLSYLAEPCRSCKRLAAYQLAHIGGGGSVGDNLRKEDHFQEIVEKNFEETGKKISDWPMMTTDGIGGF